MGLGKILHEAVRLYPTREAIVCGEVRVDYQTFAKRVWQLSQALLELGLGKGDRVAILHENCHVFLEAYLAAACQGFILVPLNFRLSPRELTTILNDSQSRMLIVQGRFQAKVRKLRKLVPKLKKVIWTVADFEVLDPAELDYEALLTNQSEVAPPAPPIDEGDVAHLYYTSGTTGRAKGVPLTHKNVGIHAVGTAKELDLRSSDCWLHAAPLFHLADAWATFAIIWVGGKHVVVPTPKPKVVLPIIAREGITLTNLIPTMLNEMVRDPDVGRYDYSSLRVLLSGGAPIALELVRKIMETFGCDYIQTYGMTETSPYLTMSTLKDHHRNLPPERQLEIKSRTGRSVHFVELKVVRPDGDEVARDDREVGEIVVKGDTVARGYWNRPEETKKAFRGGWLYTGDLATIDAEGYVNIVDRKKDMIITGGENVYSVEVEAVLYRHPSVYEVAVIGVPDEKWGEAVKACVVLKESEEVSEEELIAFCKERLSHFKVPKSIVFLEKLPKTGSGKISKRSLRKPYWQGRVTQVS